ncbi:TetR/AcrR family transcriptional regulator [Streptomyces carpinensis]|uniref:TetR/AcrR family transcriptional regulator n=1 Tax=Streptomyces carpinensis TaxID=66369 RepID=A0ABV1WIN9_9ACTN|nr:TetR/AcrR family transcriptional regulator [Streptomyces carpinensis]
MLEEAMRAIAQHGLAALTMSGLAERLGTSGGHILYYFGSKDRLLLEALRWSEDRLNEERRALLSRRTTVPRRLDAFLELYLPDGPRDPRWMLWVELWARAAGNGELTTAQEEIDRAWQEDLERLLVRGVRQGRFGLPEEEAPAAADELLALLDGLSTRVVLGLRGATREVAVRTARRAARNVTRPIE